VGTRGGRVLVLPLALLAVACGGSSGPSFSQRADSICRREITALRALPTPRTFAELRSAYDRRHAIIREEIALLAGLDPPNRLHASLRGLVEAIQNEVVAAEDLRVASLSGDIESAQGAGYRGKRAAAEAFRFSRHLGLRTCGRQTNLP